MRKLLSGCLVVIVLGAVAVGVLLYFGYRAARPVVDSASEYLDRARAVATLGNLITNKTPFVPPANRELTEAQVTRFLSVHDRVGKALGPRRAELEQRAAALQQKLKERSGERALSDIAEVFSDLSGIFLEARRAHVEGLNAEGFSADEYSWVRLRVYEAAGVELAGSLDLSALEAMLRKGAAGLGVEAPTIPAPDLNVPEKNRALVKPFAPQLKAWLPLAFLGM